MGGRRVQAPVRWTPHLRRQQGLNPATALTLYLEAKNGDSPQGTGRIPAGVQAKQPLPILNWVQVGGQESFPSVTELQL